MNFNSENPFSISLTTRQIVHILYYSYLSYFKMLVFPSTNLVPQERLNDHKSTKLQGLKSTVKRTKATSVGMFHVCICQKKKKKTHFRNPCLDLC